MIEVQHLTKRFGKVTAVEDLSFRVQPGRVTGFLGPNGAGKTTTMRLVLGLDRADAGRATVAGRPYRTLASPLRTVGALLDATALHKTRSALDHLLYLAQASRIPRSRVGEVLGFVGLDGVAGRRAGGFSLGMCQRLGMAAALLGDPGVLLFDEPINGLDPEGIVWARQLMRSLAADGRTVLVSSHLMSEMALTADHLIVVGRGRLVADMGVEEFVRSSSGQSVLVCTPQAELLAGRLREAGAAVDVGTEGALTVRGMDAKAVGKLAAANAVELHQLVSQQASLEEAFMELTQENLDYEAAAPSANEAAR